MKNIYSVGQVNAYIKNMFVQDFFLKRIYVKGEVSNCKYHTSGHVYFSLKDETGTIACIMFARERKGLAFPMKNGQRVIVLGNISVYERGGSYQLYANEVHLDGIGLLYEKFEALKRELDEMGMFAPEYKQPIPKYLQKLGIVTAPTGAAIRDIINVCQRRNPYVQLILYPALVQGNEAAASIVRGIEMLDEYGVDAMIVGRGGGSIEDLWPFNEEEVAKAIFHCSTPVISAVGHETDTTIADFVADLRAPTPSAAAELAVADVNALIEALLSYKIRLSRAMAMQMKNAIARTEQYQLKINHASPKNLIREKRQMLIEKEEKLQRMMEQQITNRQYQLQLYIERLNGLSPLKKLNAGYAFVLDEKDQRVTSVDTVKANDLLRVYVADGCIKARVASIERNGQK